MAVLDPAKNASVVYRDGHADSVVLIALRNVSTDDTLDVGPSGMNLLQVINRGVCISVTSFVEISATRAGTVVTMPAGLTTDAGFLLLWGSGT
jgi:hypothetical protein